MSLIPPLPDVGAAGEESDRQQTTGSSAIPETRQLLSQAPLDLGGAGSVPSGVMLGRSTRLSDALVRRIDLGASVADPGLLADTYIRNSVVGYVELQSLGGGTGINPSSRLNGLLTNLLIPGPAGKSFFPSVLLNENLLTIIDTNPAVLQRLSDAGGYGLIVVFDTGSIVGSSPLPYRWERVPIAPNGSVDTSNPQNPGLVNQWVVPPNPLWPYTLLYPEWYGPPPDVTHSWLLNIQAAPRDQQGTIYRVYFQLEFDIDTTLTPLTNEGTSFGAALVQVIPPTDPTDPAEPTTLIIARSRHPELEEPVVHGLPSSVAARRRVRCFGSSLVTILRGQDVRYGVFWIHDDAFTSIQQGIPDLPPGVSVALYSPNGDIPGSWIQIERLTGI